MLQLQLVSLDYSPNGNSDDTIMISVCSFILNKLAT